MKTLTSKRKEAVMPRILFWDLETAPFLIEAWGTYEVSAMDTISDRYILCGCAKWLGEDKVMTVALTDFSGYKPAQIRRKNGSMTINSTMDGYDIGPVQELHALLSEADIVVAHNGDKFDVKVFNARALVNDLGPPAPYRTIDTLKVARRFFSLGSNRLDELARVLGIGRKMQTGGKALWKGCSNGDPKAWKKMVDYCSQDVLLLEEVYLRLRPWMSAHPNLGIYEEEAVCPKCGSQEVHRRGTRETNLAIQHRYQCQDCGGWSYTVANQKPLKARKKIQRSI